MNTFMRGSVKHIRQDSQVKRLQDAFAPYLKQSELLNHSRQTSVSTASQQATVTSTAYCKLLQPHIAENGALVSLTPASAFTMTSPQSHLTSSSMGTTPTNGNLSLEHSLTDMDFNDAQLGTKVYTVELERAASFCSVLGLEAVTGTLDQTPPHQPTYDAIITFMYASSSHQLEQLLAESDDAVFGALRNAHYLGHRSGSQNDGGVYAVVARWLIKQPAILKRIVNSYNWSTNIVPAAFILQLFQEIKSFKKATISKKHAAIEVLKDFDMVFAVLWWSRKERANVPTDAYRVRDSWKWADLLALVDFSRVPKADLMAELERHVDSKERRPESPQSSSDSFTINDNAMTEVIRVASIMYSSMPQIETAPVKKFTLFKSIKRIFHKKPQEQTQFIRV